MTDGQAGRIPKGPARAPPCAGGKRGTGRPQGLAPHLHQAGVAHQRGERPAPMRLHIAQILVLARPVARLMTTPHTRPPCAQPQARLRPPRPPAFAAQRLSPRRCKLPTAVVTVTDQRYTLPDETLLLERIPNADGSRTLVVVPSGTALNPYPDHRPSPATESRR